MFADVCHIQHSFFQYSGRLFIIELLFLFPCISLNEHSIGGDTPCWKYNLCLFFFAGYGGYRGHYYGKRSADAEPGYGYYGWVGLVRTHTSIYIITIIVRYGGYRGGYYGHGYGHGMLLISYRKYNPMGFFLCRLRILRLKSSRSSCWFNQIRVQYKWIWTFMVLVISKVFNKLIPISTHFCFFIATKM